MIIASKISNIPRVVRIFDPYPAVKTYLSSIPSFTITLVYSHIWSLSQNICKILEAKGFVDVFHRNTLIFGIFDLAISFLFYWIFSCIPIPIFKNRHWQILLRVPATFLYSTYLFLWMIALKARPSLQDWVKSLTSTPGYLWVVFCAHRSSASFADKSS